MKLASAVLLCAVSLPRCERTTEVQLLVHTDSPVDLTLACPHLKATDRLGKTPYGPFRAHVGDTLLFTDEDAGFYYAESVEFGDPTAPPRLIDRQFNLRR